MAEVRRFQVFSVTENCPSEAKNIVLEATQRNKAKLLKPKGRKEPERQNAKTVQECYAAREYYRFNDDDDDDDDEFWP